MTEAAAVIRDQSGYIHTTPEKDCGQWRDADFFERKVKLGELYRIILYKYLFQELVLMNQVGEIAFHSPRFCWCLNKAVPTMIHITYVYIYIHI